MGAPRLRGAETPSLAASDLLHETLIKLMDAPPDWHDRAHFLRIGVPNAFILPRGASSTARDGV